MRVFVTNKQVILYGFKKMGEFIFTPLVREMTGVYEVVVAYHLKDLETLGKSLFVDVIVLNAMAIGFNMHRELDEIKLQFPEAFIVCVSPHGLSHFLCWKFIKHGVDALVVNIATALEFKRAVAAIQSRTRYVPPDYRRSLDNTYEYTDRSFNFLTLKEYQILVLTLKGLTLKEIAFQVGIAETTACTMRKNTFKKTGCHSFIELVKMGVQNNLHCIDERFFDEIYAADIGCEAYAMRRE